MAGILSVLAGIVLIIIIAYAIFWVVENPTFRPQHPVIYKIPQPSGRCIINSSTNPYRASCEASDPTNLTSRYTLMVYRESNIVGGEEEILNKNFPGPSFTYNFTLPINYSYSYEILSYSVNDLVTVVSAG